MNTDKQPVQSKVHTENKNHCKLEMKKDKNTVNLHWIIRQRVPCRGCFVVVVIGVQECVLHFCAHGVQDKEGSHNNGCSSLSVKGCKIVSVHVSIKCIP